MSVDGRAAEVPLRQFPPDGAEAPCLSPEVGFPAVLVTSRMIESMERAATRLMRPRLSPGESSQGVELKLTHAAATLPGGPMRYEATCRGTTGRLHHFLICAFDSSGLVATCEHTRAVVSPRRLLAQARRRAGRPSMLLEP